MQTLLNEEKKKKGDTCTGMVKRLRSKILLLILFVIVVLSAGTAVFAYFNNIARTDSVVFSSGKVRFVWQGSFLDHDLVVPSLELVDQEDPLQLQNDSTIPTELRLRIVGVSSLVGDQDIEYLFDVLIDTSWVIDGSYYYYQGAETDSITEPGKFIIPVNQGAIIPVISSLQIDGYNVKNEHSGETVSILLYFQAKQSQHVDWTTLGSLQFTFSFQEAKLNTAGDLYD